MELGLGLEGSVVVITGAGGQIGRIITEAFLSAGCFVGALDIDASKFTRQHENLQWVQTDTTDEGSVESAWKDVQARFGSWPTICVCAAALDLSFVEHHRSAITMSAAQFRRTLDVNVTGTFITAKTWLSHIDRLTKPEKPDTNGAVQQPLNGPNGYGRAQEDYTLGTAKGTENVSLIIIGSEAGVFGVAGNPDYAASKSAVQNGLMLSLAPDAARVHPRARVNAICPGSVDTPAFRAECAQDDTGSTFWIESEATVASRRPVRASDVARLCLSLASDRWSSSTNGQTLRVDGGKSGRLYWDRDGQSFW